MTKRLVYITAAIILILGGLYLRSTPPEDKEYALPYPEMAYRIIQSLAPAAEERVIIGYDPDHMAELTRRTQFQLQERGIKVILRPVGDTTPLEDQLAEADIFIWMPLGPNTDPEVAGREVEITNEWVKQAKNRQLHFHWDDGTRAADGMYGTHSKDIDELYLAALDIDYIKLNDRMDRAIDLLKKGPIQVTTPDGTDLHFSFGDRVFTKQNGDASLAATAPAQVLIQRHIELPAGALRVSPLEETVHGTLVIPSLRLASGLRDRSGDLVEVKNLTLTFKAGKIIKFTADEGREAFENYLNDNPALWHFREIGIGFNPKLIAPEDRSFIPYYGYGAGVVRLSLGNNQELGGAVTGTGVRWILFSNTTITTANGDILLKEGTLSDF